MNVKNLILAIALLIATVVVSAIEVKPDNCLAQIFLGIMGIIILIDWISSYVKYCSQIEEQKEKERENKKHISKIIENNISNLENEKNRLNKEISDLENEKERLEEDKKKLKQELNGAKYNEGFFEWYKLKVLVDKDYIKRSFSDAIIEYEEFKKSVNNSNHAPKD